jgi:DNA-binding GntR family transcriptional regulator
LLDDFVPASAERREIRDMSEIALKKHSAEFDADGPTPFESNGVYEALREDIIEGRLAANQRLVVGALAARYGTSTNPVREALQQLRGEGFVVIVPNRGARVRAIDEDFLRDTNEIEMLIEPYFTRWFVSVVTEEEIVRMEALQGEMERNNFADLARHGELDTLFHRVVYERHYNQQAFDLWHKHREILNAITRRFPMALGRRAVVKRDHRALVAALKAQDADAAASIMVEHVAGSGRHMIEQIRAARRG